MISVRTRAIAFLAVAALAASACSSTAATPAPTPTQPAASQTAAGPTATPAPTPVPLPTIPTDQLVVSGKLTVCSDIPYPPQEFFDASGNPTGSDIDLGAEIAKRLGLG